MGGGFLGLGRLSGPFQFARLLRLSGGLRAKLPPANITVTSRMIIVRSETRTRRRLPPTKGISEYPRMGSSLSG